MHSNDERAIDRRVFMGVVASGALAAHTLAAGRRFFQDEMTNVFEWSELTAGKVWATTHGGSGGNVMVVASEGQVLCIDAKLAGIAPLLRKEAEARAGSPVTVLLNTHHHGDHTGGNFAFSTNARLLAHAAAARRISQSADTYTQQADGAKDMAARMGSVEAKDAALAAWEPLAARGTSGQMEYWLPTETVNRYPMHLPIGRINARVYHFGPGHTDSDLVVHLPEQNIIHCGDLLFNGLHPFLDAKGGVSAAGWARSLRATIELCDDRTVVVGGHGPIGDRAALEKQLGYMESIMEEVGKVGRQGMPKGAIMRMSWPFMNGLGLGQLKPRAIAVVYDELFPVPPEGAGRPEQIPAGRPGRGILKPDKP